MSLFEVMWFLTLQIDRCCLYHLIFPQYVYFRMGVKQGEMVKSRLFRFTLDEVRHRHSFLERRGLYQTPDKKGQTVILNPKLDSILSVDQNTFLTDVALASAEEYDVFKRLMAREWHEQEQEGGRIEADSDDDEDDDDDEKEETGGRSSYRKRRKKWQWRRDWEESDVPNDEKSSVSLSFCRTQVRH